MILASIGPAPAATGVITKDDLPLLAGGAFTRHVAAVNTAYTAARDAYEQACVALGDLLTEQIARAVGERFPAAARLLASPARVEGPDGVVTDRLLPSAVVAVDAAVIGYVDPFSPVVWMLERLTPHLGLVDCELDLLSRTWTFPYGR